MHFHYRKLVSGCIAAYLFFHELPPTWMLAGATLIVTSGLFIALSAHRQTAESTPDISPADAENECD